MDMMLRRRAMMGAERPSSYWDYEWDYTMGLPNNNGLTLQTSGTQSGTLQDDGLLVKANNSSYRFYTKSDFSVVTGIAEGTFYIPTVSNAARSALAFLKIGASGGVGLSVYANLTSAGAKKWTLYNGTTMTNGTKIGNWAFDTLYTLRLEIDNGVGDVYLDETPIRSNINLSNIKYPGPPAFGAQNGAGAGAVWKSFKIKKIQ